MLMGQLNCAHGLLVLDSLCWQVLGNVTCPQAIGDVNNFTLTSWPT